MMFGYLFLRLRRKRIKGLQKDGGHMRHHLRAERPAERGEDRAPMPQRGFDIGVLALGYLVQELIDVELLRLSLGLGRRGGRAASLSG